MIDTFNNIELCLIAAIAKNGTIGFKNRIPWYLPEDLRHFRALTLHGTVIMGRHTFESLPGLLSKRRMIVVSRTLFPREGIEIVGSLTEALNLCGKPVALEAPEGSREKRVFIIGGAALYQEALPVVRRLYLTEVDQVFTGDTFFPSASLETIRESWHEVRREQHQGENGLCFSFVEYVRGGFEDSMRG